MSARHRTAGNLAALRRLLDTYERHGTPLDRATVETLAALVANWPSTEGTDRAQLARSYYAEGKSLNVVAQLVGAHRHTVSAWCAGLPRRCGHGQRVPDEARQRALELVRTGHTQADAAEQVGISAAVVSRLVHEHDQQAA